MGSLKSIETGSNLRFNTIIVIRETLMNFTTETSRIANSETRKICHPVINIGSTSEGDDDGIIIRGVT